MIRKYSEKDNRAFARGAALSGITPDWMKKYEKYSKDMGDTSLPFAQRKAAAKFVSLNFVYAQEYYSAREGIKSEDNAPLVEEKR